MVAMVQSRFGAAAAAAAAAHRPGPLLVGSDSDDSDVEMVSQQWDFLEIYTPPRVCFAVARYNLLTGPSMDLETGFDFMTMESRASCLQQVQEHLPRFLMLSPPCTMYSPLQALFNLHKMSEEEKRQRFLEADTLLNFAMALCRLQSNEGRYFAFEHPDRATSWDRPSVRAVLQLPGTVTVKFDQCQTGLMSPGDNPKPIKKRTVLMTNAPAIQSVFAPLQCNCPRGSHQTIEGSIDGISLSKWCQHYTPQLCNKIADAVAGTLLEVD